MTRCLAMTGNGNKDPLLVEAQNFNCVCETCRQLRICAKLGMAPTATTFPPDHLGED